MRRHPHCVGCDQRIWWGLVMRKAADRNFWLYFHRRCVVPYEAGNKGSALAALGEKT